MDKEISKDEMDKSISRKILKEEIVELMDKDIFKEGINKLTFKDIFILFVMVTLLKSHNILEKLSPSN